MTHHLHLICSRAREHRLHSMGILSFPNTFIPSGATSSSSPIIVITSLHNASERSALVHCIWFDARGAFDSVFLLFCIVFFFFLFCISSLLLLFNSFQFGRFRYIFYCFIKCKCFGGDCETEKKAWVSITHSSRFEMHINWLMTNDD